MTSLHDSQSAGGSRAVTYEEFAASLAFPPTAEQREVIESEARAIAVIAGAGSGKTATMAQRIAWQVIKGNVRPDEVLGLTFTTKAAGELAERVGKYLQDARRKGLIRDDEPAAELDAEDLDGLDRAADAAHRYAAQPTIATYNSFASQISTSYSMLIGEDPRSRLITDAERRQIMLEIVQAVDPADSRFAPFAEQKVTSTVTNCLALASEMLSHNVSVAQMRAQLEGELAALERLAAVKAKDATPEYKSGYGRRAAIDKAIRLRLAYLPLIAWYFEYKKENSLIEFADQVERANRILEKRPDLAEELSAQYKLVLLDEYQDTSTQQAAFLTAAFGNSWSVCAVGDPNQAIYGWRGAAAGALNDFMLDFGVTRNLTLSTAFRNGRQILDAANALTKDTKYRNVKVLPLTPREGASDGQVSYIHNVMREDAYANLAKQIAGAMREADTEAPTAAILCRRRSFMPLAAAALEAEGIPYEIVGGDSMIERPEIRLVRAFMWLTDEPRRGDQLLPIFNHFAIGSKDIGALYEYARGQAKGSAQALKQQTQTEVEIQPVLVEALAQLLEQSEHATKLGAQTDPPDGMSPLGLERSLMIARILQRLRQRAHLPISEFISYAMSELELPLYAQSRNTGRARARSALDSFIAMAAQYSANNPRATIGAFSEWIDAVEEYENTGEVEASADLAGEQVDPQSGVVQILTIHAAKGLEWDIVAVPELQAQKFDDYSDDKPWQQQSNAIPYPLRMDAEHLPQFSFARYVTGGYEKDLPHSKVDAFGDYYEYSKNDLMRYFGAEQRRLAYVAVTRPKATLFLMSYDLRGPEDAELVARRHNRAKEPTDLFATNQFLADMQPIMAAAKGNEPVATVELLDEIVGETQATTAGVSNALFDPATPRWPRDMDRRVDRAQAAPLHLDDAELTATINRLQEEAQVLIREQESRAPKAPMREYLTASDVVRLEDDAEAFIRDQRRPVPTAPSRAARVGTRVHAQIANHFNSPATLDLDSVAQPFQMPIDSDRELTSERAEELLARFEASPYSACPPIAIEQRVDIELAGIPVRCVIDAVLDTSGLAGHPPVTIVDWKTGRRPADLSARQFQLAVYQLAWSRAKGVPLSDIGAAYYYLGEDSASRRKVPAPQMSVEEVESRIVKQLKIAESLGGIYVAN